MLNWCCRSGEGPLLVRIGQLSLDALRRSAALASRSFKHYLGSSSSPPSPPPPPSLSRSSHASPPPQNLTQSVMGMSQQQTSQQQQQQQQQQTRQQCGILIRNNTPLDLVMGQVGTDETVSLPAESDLPYCWHTAPGMTVTAQRLLHIACKLRSTAARGVGASGPASPAGLGMMTNPPSSASPSSPLSPLPEVHNTQSAVPTSTQQNHNSPLSQLVGGRPLPGNPSPRHTDQDQKAGLSSVPELLHSSNTVSTAWNTGGSGSAPIWSESFDCTARRSCQTQVQLGGGQQCSVALCVHKVGLQWQVVLQPSFRLINKAAGTVHVHYTGQLIEGTMSHTSTRGLTAGNSFALQPTPKVRCLSLVAKLHCVGCCSYHCPYSRPHLLYTPSSLSYDLHNVMGLIK